MILWKPLSEHFMGAAVMYKGKQKQHTHTKKWRSLYISGWCTE